MLKRNKDVTSVKVQFVGILDDAEIDFISGIADEIYLPEFSGYRLEKEGDRTYKTPKYITKTRHPVIVSNMPFNVAYKRFGGFNESKIIEFYNQMKAFEKVDFLRPMENIGQSGNPSISIEVASHALENKVYVSYFDEEYRGIEYTAIGLKNREKFDRNEPQDWSRAHKY